MNNEEIRFKGVVVRCRYNSDNFKIYVVDVSKEEYPNVKRGNDGKVVVTGDLPTLVTNVEYEFEGRREYNPKFGNQYKCSNIKQELPKDENSMRTFLENIIAKSHVDTLLNVYPNIVDKIVKDDLEDIDFSKLKGIKEKTFADIKGKIIENYCLMGLVGKYGGVISMNMIKKLYDTYKSTALIEEKLKNSPYKSLTHISRIGFRTADEILLKLEESKRVEFKEPLRNSKQRMVACYEFILQQNELNGNTLMGIKELREECGRLTPECINYFVDCIKEDNKKVYVDMDNKVVGLKSTRDKETYIYNTLKDMINTKNKNNNKWLCNAELYRSLGGFNLSDEQINTINILINNNICILTAPAGSGKSASVEAVLRMCDDNDISYKLMTPTGASSKILADYTGKECKTIHRGLEFKPTSEDKTPWGLNKDNKIQEDFVVIDEFSMVDVDLFYRIMSAIDITKTKLLLVFDPYQLPSVGSGNLAQDILGFDFIPINRLTKIFRYSDGGLMNVATSVRNSQPFIKLESGRTNQIFGNKKDFIYYERKGKPVLDTLKAIYMKLLNSYSIEDIMVLACQNKGDYGTVAVNKIIQNIVQKGKDNHFMIRGETKFFEGDKVIQIRNNYKAKTLNGVGDEEECAIFNGNTGVIQKVYFDYMVIDFDGTLVKYEKEELTQIELGYCISIHKSQGSASKQVIVLSPNQHTFMLNSNLLYVGYTRARERVFAIGDVITIHRAIKKKANLTRNTWLKLYK